MRSTGEYFQVLDMKGYENSALTDSCRKGGGEKRSVRQVSILDTTRLSPKGSWKFPTQTGLEIKALHTS